MYFPYIDRITTHIDRPAPRSSPAGRGPSRRSGSWAFTSQRLSDTPRGAATAAVAPGMLRSFQSGHAGDGRGDQQEDDGRADAASLAPGGGHARRRAPQPRTSLGSLGSGCHTSSSTSGELVGLTSCARDSYGKLGRRRGAIAGQGMDVERCSGHGWTWPWLGTYMSFSISNTCMI